MRSLRSSQQPPMIFLVLLFVACGSPSPPGSLSAESKTVLQLEADSPESPTATRQHSTAETARAIGNVMLAWLVDYIRAPGTERGAHFAVAKGTPIPEASLRDILDTYAPGHRIATRDAWNHPIEVWVNSEVLGNDLIIVRSAGGDRKFEQVVSFNERVYDRGSIAPSDEGADIVWINGRLQRYPRFDERLDE